MSQNSKDYKNGKIYCIRNNIDDNIYVGSTTQPLSKRMALHRQSARNKENMHRNLCKNAGARARTFLYRTH